MGAIADMVGLWPTAMIMGGLGLVSAANLGLLVPETHKRPKTMTTPTKTQMTQITLMTTIHPTTLTPMKKTVMQKPVTRPVPTGWSSRALTVKTDSFKKTP